MRGDAAKFPGNSRYPLGRQPWPSPSPPVGSGFSTPVPYKGARSYAQPVEFESVFRKFGCSHLELAASVNSSRLTLERCLPFAFATLAEAGVGMTMMHATPISGVGQRKAGSSVRTGPPSGRRLGAAEIARGAEPRNVEAHAGGRQKDRCRVESVAAEWARTRPSRQPGDSCISGQRRRSPCEDAQAVPETA